MTQHWSIKRQPSSDAIGEQETSKNVKATDLPPPQTHKACGSPPPAPKLLLLLLRSNARATGNSYNKGRAKWQHHHPHMHPATLSPHTGLE
jgi:hypothetical protein